MCKYFNISGPIAHYLRTHTRAVIVVVVVVGSDLCHEIVYLPLISSPSTITIRRVRGKTNGNSNFHLISSTSWSSTDQNFLLIMIDEDGGLPALKFRWFSRWLPIAGWVKTRLNPGLLPTCLLAWLPSLVGRLVGWLVVLKAFSARNELIPSHSNKKQILKRNLGYCVKTKISETWYHLASVRSVFLFLLLVGKKLYVCLL